MKISELLKFVLLLLCMTTAQAAFAQVTSGDVVLPQQGITYVSNGEDLLRIDTKLHQLNGVVRTNEATTQTYADAKLRLTFYTWVKTLIPESDVATAIQRATIKLMKSGADKATIATIKDEADQLLKQ